MSKGGFEPSSEVKQLFGVDMKGSEILTERGRQSPRLSHDYWQGFGDRHDGEGTTSDEDDVVPPRLFRSVGWTAGGSSRRGRGEGSGDLVLWM